ncbi:uncharacterized protein [Choristoneura fumiferana]|uniref:uncharacterized protein n=1 Tax=Choristoneura fumiferana TaxID=7141 RepID=UPI003D154D44
MIGTNKPRPLVPGSSFIPGLGSGPGNGGARGAKNLRVTPRYHPHRTLALATHNIRTLRTDEKLIELEEELSSLRWDIMGLSEVRRKGQDTIILESGNMLFFREGDRKSQGGVGFLVRKSLINNVCLAECKTADEINNGLVETVQAVGSQFFKAPRRKRPQKLSNETIKLMELRNEMRLQSSTDMSEYGRLNRRISKSMRHDPPEQAGFRKGAP